MSCKGAALKVCLEYFKCSSGFSSGRKVVWKPSGLKAAKENELGPLIEMYEKWSIHEYCECSGWKIW